MCKANSKKGTYNAVRKLLLERSDEDLLRLLGWADHVLPLDTGQRNFAAGYIATQITSSTKPSP